MSLSEEFDRYIDPPKETLQRIMQQVKAILFDMDGPLCHLFRTYPASDATHNIKLELRKSQKLPEAVMLEDDFFELLRSVESIQESMDHWEGLLTELEMKAALDALPVPLVQRLLSILEKKHIARAIVTNNSTGAAYNFLSNNQLDHFFGNHVFGRNSPDFQQLKPNPQCLHEAMQSLKIAPAACLMIGDSVTDYQAAEAAQVPFLGYSHTFSGAKKLLDAGVEMVIPDYAPLLRLFVGDVKQ
jgi:phosphoglycolate phosphatase-like HAD superfamily hydrolase